MIRRGHHGDPGSLGTAFAVAFTASLAVYLATLAPGLPPGHDSAELTTAATLPGIAHPPGYPLYTLLGFLFTRLPLGDPAWRMNLMSAVFGALAAGLAASAFARLAGSVAAGVLGALCFAFARTPWRLAVGAEVFTLHLALEAALLLAAARWRSADGAGRRRWIVGQAFLLGLGLAHHQTVVLLLPGLAGWWWLARDGRPAGFTPWALPALGAGLSPYLYLPLRAAANPALNWGDPDSLDRFLWVVTRSGYGTLRLSTASGSGPAPGAHLEAWARSLVTWQFPLLSGAAGLAGSALAIARRRPEGVLLGGLALAAGPVWALVGAQPAGEGYFDMLERFYASSYLGFAGLVALALGEALGRVPEGRRRAWAAAALAVLPLLGLGVNWRAVSERGQYLVPDSLAAMVEPLPAGALVVTGSDLTSGMMLYARLVQGRPVEPFLAGLAGSGWYREQLPADRAEALRGGGLAGVLLQARQAGVPVHLDHVPPEVPGFFVPEGLLYRYLAPGEPLPDRTEASRRSLEILDAHPRRGAWRLDAARPFWSRHLVRTWAWAYATAGQGLLEGEPAEAARALEIALDMDPSAPEAWTDLGSARLAAGRVAAAGEAFRRALRLEPTSARAMAGLVQVAEAEGRPEEAAQWRQRLRGAGAAP